MKLNQLKKGQKASIIHISDNKDTCKLCSLGFKQGQIITIIKEGNSLIVKVLNSRYALDHHCLDCIEVEII